MEYNSSAIDKISNFSKKFSAISKHLGYRKFENKKFRVLLFNQNSWINPEIGKALDKLGYPNKKINVEHLDPENKSLTLDEYIHFHHILIKDLIDFKPDCILTVNQAAFDSLGLLTRILEQFGIPHISWFVDSPLYILKNAEPQISDFFYIFSWESTYLSRLRELGFKNIFYLPLATDPDIFMNPDVSEGDRDLFNCDIAFVGNSNTDAVQKWMREEYNTPEFHELISKSVEIQINDISRPMIDILLEIDKDNVLDKINSDLIISFETLCVLKSTEIQRMKIVNFLAENFNLKIFGDNNWMNIFPENYIKPVDYYSELPKLYKCAKIVINVTSCQMNSAINQRSFDAFISDGLVISDYRTDFDLLFGKGVFPTYRNESQLYDLIKYYLENPVARTNKIREIKDIILKEHRYEYRLEKMITEVSDKYRKNLDEKIHPYE